MEILCHRGWPLTADDALRPAAFIRAFEQGFGVELDIRDHDAELVISHDVAQADAMSLRELFTLYRHYFPTNHKAPTLALNIKSSELQQGLNQLVEEFDMHHHFLFDMAIPDHLKYLNQTNLTCFTRQSDIEATPILYQRSHGVWLDEMQGPWLSQDVLMQHLAQHKPIAIVSPELHQRPHMDRWHDLRRWLNDLPSTAPIMLCTDYPEQAYDFFR